MHLSKKEPGQVIADPVLISYRYLPDYFLHLVENEYLFAKGREGAEIFDREAAIEFCWRNQVRKPIFEPVQILVPVNT